MTAPPAQPQTVARNDHADIRLLAREGRVALGVFDQAALEAGYIPRETDRWMDLSRDEINHLIRELRQSRDLAYGVDA